MGRLCGVGACISYGQNPSGQALLALPRNGRVRPVRRPGDNPFCRSAGLSLPGLLRLFSVRFCRSQQPALARMVLYKEVEAPARGLCPRMAGITRRGLPHRKPAEPRRGFALLAVAAHDHPDRQDSGERTRTAFSGSRPIRPSRRDAAPPCGPCCPLRPADGTGPNVPRKPRGRSWNQIRDDHDHHRQLRQKAHPRRVPRHRQGRKPAGTASALPGRTRTARASTSTST